jgi:hypothetical protein
MCGTGRSKLGLVQTSTVMEPSEEPTAGSMQTADPVWLPIPWRLAHEQHLAPSRVKPHFSMIRAEPTFEALASRIVNT